MALGERHWLLNESESNAEALGQQVDGLSWGERRGDGCIRESAGREGAKRYFRVGRDGRNGNRAKVQIKFFEQLWRGRVHRRAITGGNLVMDFAAGGRI
ncbi:MAG: hypothetical protein CMN84_01325 [Spongiibacteraceae bacterium]|nr:hypothetical protein [Spongiibacteraceae bacterium]